MKHFANASFWDCYDKLPDSVRSLADKNFILLKENPRHPSLHFKQAGRYRSVRVGIHHRALAVEAEHDLVWFWIGSHAEYNRLMR
jgi:hypothetical protein